MATLKQADAIIRIYKRLGKSIGFDEAFAWDVGKASKFIGEHYLSYYEEIRKGRNERGWII